MIRRLLSVAFLVFAAALGAGPAWAQGLVAPQALTLDQSTPRFQSAPVRLNPKTDRISIALRRPTTADPIDWPADATLRVSLVVMADGVRHHATATFTGGVRRDRHGVEKAAAKLVYGLPTGFFGARSGVPKRLGEHVRTPLMGHVEIELVRGAAVRTAILGSDVRERDAPQTPFHSSVAVDVASEAANDTGDEFLAWSHTFTGADRAVLVGVMNAGSVPMAVSTVTVPGTTMTNRWDVANATFWRQSVWTGVAPTTGAQTINATLPSTSDGTYMGVSISLTGVDQTTSVGTPSAADTGTSTTPSVTVGSLTTDGMIVGVVSGDVDSVTAGTNETAYASGAVFAGGDGIGLVTQSSNDGGVIAPTITTSGQGRYLRAIEFKPAGGGGASAPPLRSLLGVGL